jgi:hypothetical protein
MDSFRRCLRGRRGSSVAMAWVYVIQMIFAVGFIYIILDQIMRVTLYNLAVESGADALLLQTIMYVWSVLPFLWIGASILYGIVYTIRRGGESEYY